MKWAHVVFLAFFSAGAGPEKFTPEFSLGGPGNAPLAFRIPGALLTVGNFLYVADNGNGRIQKISGDGEFIAQSGQWVGNWNAIANMASDLAGMIYASGLHDSGVAQFDADLLPASFHPVPAGFLFYRKSGDFLICQPDQATVLRWRMEGRRIQDATAGWMSKKPLLHCALWNNLFWTLDKQTIRAGDLFGTVKIVARLEKPVRRGFFCPSGNRMILILDRTICEFRNKRIVTLGQMPDNILPGGAAAMDHRIWISDQTGNRLLRFRLPPQENP